MAKRNSSGKGIKLAAPMPGRLREPKRAGSVSKPASAPANEVKSLPFFLFEVQGTELKLCTDFDAWSDAEYKFSLEGHNANLLNSFLTLNFRTTRILFACAVHHYHPEIGFEAAVKMLTPPYAAAAGALFAREIVRQLPASMQPDLTPQAVK